MKKLRKALVLMLAFAMTLAFASCGGGSSSEETAEDNGELNIYMWSEYMSEDFVKKFEEETGVKVNFSYMNSSEEAVAKITAGGGDEYDLVMPCDADMTSLIEGGYLEEIDTANMENFQYLDDAYKGRSFDPDTKYAIPYFMNYVYVVYNPETCPKEITHYEDLLDPAFAGQITSVDGIRNLFPIALVALGYDPNSTNDAEIEEAYGWLQKYMKNVKYLNSDDAEKELVSGGCSVGFVFDGMFGRALEDNPDLEVAPLKDAVQLGVDEFVIPKGAKNKENAEKFLNFMLDPENMAANIMDGHAYTCPNSAAVELCDDSYKLAKNINIPKEIKENYFLQLDVGDAMKTYDKFYTRLKSE
jgi:spermidine/putrescine transport system substrate-binding protein